MIDAVHTRRETLLVEWSDGVTSEYPWTWLRENSHDPATLHPVTHQRQIAIGDIARDLAGEHAALEGDVLVVTWPVGTRASRLPVDFLHRHRTPGPRSGDPTTAPVLWDRDTIAGRWPTVEHARVMGGDDGVREWLDLVATYGFAMVTGVPTDPGATEALLRRVGYVRHTIFGGMWDFQADLAMADTAYTDLELLPHTDGTYSHDAPGLQLLHVLAFDGSGGESTMVDGFRIADELRRTAPDAYAVLATEDVVGQYLGDGVHLVAARPVLRHDRSGALVQVSFNNADRAPLLLPPERMAALHEALRAFEALTRDQAFQWRRANPPGEAMLFDNWRVLHGRTAFSGHRHLCGGYVNREDFESRRRVLAAG